MTNYNRIIDLLSDLVFIYNNQESKIIFCNVSFQKKLNIYDPNIAFLSAVFVNEEEILKFKKSVEEVLKNKNENDFFVKNNFLLKTDSKSKAFICTLKYYDSEDCVLCIANEVNKNDEFCIDFKESSDKYQDLINHSPDIFYKFSSIRGALFWSKSVTSILGYTQDEMFTNPFLWTNSIHPNDLEKVTQVIHNELYGKDYKIEYQVKTKQGNWIWISDCIMFKSFNSGEIIIEGYATDITESKKIHLELIQANERFSKAFNFNAFALGISDFDTGKFIDVNHGFENLTGYKKTEVIGKTSFELELWKTKFLRKQIIDELNKKSPLKEIELDIFHKNGSIRQCLWSAEVIFLNEKKCILAAAFDITSQKQTERNLIEALKVIELSEKKAQALNQAIPDMLFRMNTNGVYLDYKANPEDLYYQEKSIIGLSAYEIMPAEFAEILKEKIEDTIESNQIITFDYSLPYGKNEMREYEARMVKIANNEIISIVRDVSQQRIAEKKLQWQKDEYAALYQKYKQQNQKLKQAIAQIEEGSERFSFLFENMIQGVVYQNASGDIIESNKAAERILGLTYDQLRGRNSLDPHWRSINPDGSEFSGEKHPAMLALSTGKVILNQTMGIFNPVLESYTWIKINAYPKFKTNQKKPYLVIVTFEDITDMRNTTHELISAKEKAEESDKLKSAFLKNISHEIRTPMNAISGFSKLLLKSEISSDKRQTFYNYIQTSVNQLLNIIESIITISHIETKQLQVNLLEFKPQDLLTDIYNQFENHSLRTERADLFFKLSLPAVFSKKITTDYTKLNQILKILLDNGFKFTQKGGVEFGFREENNTISFFVKDTGIGIAKEQQQIIFKSFAQAHESIPDHFGGIGLGLAIVAGLCHIIQAKVLIESEPFYGTEFIVQLPLNAQNQLLEENKNTNNLIANWHNKTILIAEDEDFNYLYIEEILEPTKIQILHAINGQEAINLFKTNKIDLVLMDLKMPILDGFQAAQQIRIEHKEIPIIAQTAFSFKREKCLNSGFSDYITKPFAEEQLLNLLARYLD